MDEPLTMMDDGAQSGGGSVYEVGATGFNEGLAHGALFLKQSLFIGALAINSGRNQFLDWIPTHGNYNGTQDRVNAWVKWQTYNDLYGDGSNIPSGQAGKDKILELLDHYEALYPNSDPHNLKPIDAQDWVGFWHDLDLALGGLINDIKVDLTAAVSSLIVFIEDRQLYSALAAPFLGTVALAAHAVENTWQAASAVGGGFATGAAALGTGFGNAFSSLSRGDYGGAMNDMIDGVGAFLEAIGQGFMEAWRAITPVIVDLGIDGINLISASDSGVVLIDDGIERHSGWVSGDDAIIAFDEDRDGVVDGSDEFGLVRFLKGAKTDLEGLAAFDSTGDGLFDAHDDLFNDFIAWRDLNGDGLFQEGEGQSLTEAGITSISLAGDGERKIVEGNVVHGAAAVTLASGQATIAWDVAFASSSAFGDVRAIGAGSQSMTLSDGTTFMSAADDGDRFIVTDLDAPDSRGLLWISTGAGNDHIILETDRSAVMKAGGGDDWFVGGNAPSTFIGGSGNDLLQGGTASDTYVILGGESGNDIINDSGGRDSVLISGASDQFDFTLIGRDLVISRIEDGGTVRIVNALDAYEALDRVRFDDREFLIGDIVAEAAVDIPSFAFEDVLAPVLQVETRPDFVQ